MTLPEESRFETDPTELVEPPRSLPEGWRIDVPDPDAPSDVAGLTTLLRAHEKHGRGWAGADSEDVLVEVSDRGLRTRQNIVVRDADGVIRAWGSVHDRAGGRMLFVHVVERTLEPAGVAGACSDVLVDWAVAQAREVGAARGLAVQQIDTGAFEGDGRQARWLREAGFTRVRTWWQMSRPVRPEEARLVPSTSSWHDDGVRVRLVRRDGGGGEAADGTLPDEADLHDVHDVLEEAFRDHFNSWEETFEEFVHRLREDPGHRWDHWWLAQLVDDPDAPEGEGDDRPTPAGALVGTVSESSDGPDGSYVSYLGVVEAARGRGVAKRLLHTIIADAAERGRDRVGLEVDADSPTGATEVYTGMGWTTDYVTESWHRDVEVS